MIAAIAFSLTSCKEEDSETFTIRVINNGNTDYTIDRNKITIVNYYNGNSFTNDKKPLFEGESMDFKVPFGTYYVRILLDDGSFIRTEGTFEGRFGITRIVRFNTSWSGENRVFNLTRD